MVSRMKLRAATILSHDLAIPAILALVQLILQILFHGNYGYFRDELYYIACSEHPAFGYVDQPPLSIFILRLSRFILGDSLHALRFLPALAGSCVILFAALTARKLGGKRFAMRLASFSVLAAHGLIGNGKTFSMNPFDVLFWAIAGYITVMIFRDQKPRLWLLFGLTAGLGLLNKYSIGFMLIGLVGGMLLTRQRKHLFSKWFWLGAAIAMILFLPHLIWQIIHGFPSFEFMRNASQNKNVSLGFLAFLLGQIRDMNIANALLWISGIWFLFRLEKKRFRPLAWMYPIIFVIMAAGNAKVYYLSAIYPLFLAAGSVWLEKIVQANPFKWLKAVYPGLQSAVALIILPFAIPVLPVETFIQYENYLGLKPRAEERSVVTDLPQYYADQFGWKEMVQTFVDIYKKLSFEEQSKCYIYVRNYGEAAAIDFFGREYGLPKAHCGHNNYWLWGPGERTGEISIILGDSRDLNENLADLQRRWKHVELVAITNARHAMPLENGRMVFLCKGMNTTFQALWADERYYI